MEAKMAGKSQLRTKERYAGRREAGTGGTPEFERTTDSTNKIG